MWKTKKTWREKQMRGAKFLRIEFWSQNGTKQHIFGTMNIFTKFHKVSLNFTRFSDSFHDIFHDSFHDSFNDCFHDSFHANSHDNSLGLSLDSPLLECAVLSQLFWGSLGRSRDVIGDFLGTKPRFRLAPKPE